MPRIALVEPYDHGEVLYVLCELLLEQQDMDLWVFTQRYIYDHAPNSIKNAVEINWRDFEPGKRLDFFQQQQKSLNDCDLVIWITAFAPYNWLLKLGLKSPLILIIHNRNNWFPSLVNFGIHIAKPSILLKDIACFFRWCLSYRRQQRRLLQKVTALGYGSQFILAEAHRKNHLPDSRNALWVPFTYLKHRPSVGNKATEAVKIVIPGSVTDNGRDYYAVARAFTLALPQINRPVHLILLGKAGPAGGLRQLQQLGNERFQMETYSHWVGQKAYAECLKAADFLILPLRPWHKVSFLKEYWGISGQSGSVSDMVYYGLPALCSSSHPLDAELERWVDKYSDSQSLAALLITWINELKFQKVKMVIKDYDGIYKKERASSLLMDQLIDFIKK